MPEAVADPPNDLRVGALSAVEARIAEWAARPLDQSELITYVARGATHGWRVEIMFSDDLSRRLDLIVDRRFPRSAPRVALVDRPELLTWPHVERDGVLCLLHSASETSPFSPADAAVRVLGEACDLIEQALAGKLDDDFREEFASYWDWAKTEGSIRIRSLVEPHGPSRAIRIWRGRALYLAGEADDQLSTWSELTGGGTLSSLEMGVLGWLDELPVPALYPSSGSELCKLVDPLAKALIHDLAAQHPERLVVLLAGKTSNGTAFGGVTLRKATGSARGGGPRPGLGQAGFRAGSVPPKLLADRFIGSATVMRSDVDRADPSWIHGRDQDLRHASLARARVTVLGCGSIGAPVAVALAQAGVGNLRLVDPELLKAANIGRHVLGARSLDQWKADAVAMYIRQHLPHVRVEAHHVAWESLPATADVFADDLVVSAMGSWSAEGALNHAHLKSGRQRPIVYGWTEPHACAGHAVAVGGRGGCLQCGLDYHGASLLKVTAWPKEHALKQEPACGAVFQPYGPVELGYIVSMVADLSLDSLLGEEGGKQRTWIAARRRLEAAGGSPAPEWLAAGMPTPEVGGIVLREWTQLAGCPECSANAVAA